MSKLYRTINFKIKDINEEDRSFTAIASDDSTDRHGESIKQEGWDLTNFVKNPVVPWGHDYYMPPVAKATEIGMVDGKLMFKPKFASIAELSEDPANPSDWAKFTDTIYRMYKGGYLRAFSVGFIPKEMEGDTFIKQELLEVSAVTVPSNPNALALAFKEGVIDESERKILIKTYEAQIRGLTDLGKLKNNQDQELEMEEVKQLLEEAVKTLTDSIAEVKSTVTELETKMTALATTKDVEDVSEDEDEVKADPEEAGEKSDNSDEDAGADDDSKELTDEEAAKMLKQLTGEEIDKQLGKVD